MTTVTRDEAATRLAKVVGDFVRAHGHEMPDAEIRAFADNIRDGNEATYFTPDSPTLSYVAYDPTPDGPDYRSIYAFSRDLTGHTLDAELDALLPIDLLTLIIDPTVSRIRSTMLALGQWYKEIFGPLPDVVLNRLPRNIRKGAPFGWHEHGYAFHIGPADVNGYIIRITEQVGRKNEELGHYTVHVILRDLSLRATERFVTLLGNAPLPYYVDPIDPSGATDLADLVATIIKWWYPQEMTYTPYPEGEHAQFVESIRRGEQAVLMITSHIVESYRIVVGLPDSEGNIARLEMAYSTGLWKPVPYSTECINLALEQTLGRDALLALFRPA